MKSNVWANAVLCIIVFLIIGYAVSRVAQAPNLPSLLKPEVEESPLVRSLHDSLLLEGYQFEINQVTKQVRAEFDVNNEGKNPVRDIVVSCDLRDRSGQSYGQGRWVLYKSLAAKTAHRYIVEDQRFIPYQVIPESISCRIIDVESAETAVASHEEGGH